MIPRIVDDNARYHVSQFQSEALPSLRRIRGLLSSKPKRSAKGLRRTTLKKAMSLDEIEPKTPRMPRRRRRASVTSFSRTKSWEDLSVFGDPMNDSFCNTFNTSMDFEFQHPSEDVKMQRFRSQSFEETPDTVPRRPRRSSCMGSMAPSSHRQHNNSHCDSPSRSPTLGDSIQNKNNDFRPIRPRRSSLAMYETGASGSAKEESLRTIWSQASSDACPTLPQRLFIATEGDPIGSRDGSVCFPAVA